MIEDDARLFARGLHRQKRHMAYDYAMDRAKHLKTLGDDEGNSVWRMVADFVAEFEQREQPPQRPEALAS